MSGPTTVIFSANPGAVLLAASAIQAAQAVQAGYAAAEMLRAERSAEHAERLHAQNEARQHGELATGRRIAAAEARHARLAALCAGLSLPAEPPPARDADDGTYLQALTEAGQQLEARLQRHSETLRAATPDAALGLAAELLAAHDEQTAPASPPPGTGQTRVDELLGRLNLLEQIPPALATLARELAGTRDADRAELLGNELRRQVQEALETARARRILAAQAIVLEQSLKDLGYEVETIGETLFVDGGVVHFSRPGWGDYQVRLRVAAGGHGANFNVVRAVDAGNNERSVLDHLAEDRWCAEFPALLRTLAERGMQMNVTRRLAAGELPVQLVARDRLPRFARDEECRPAAQPRQMRIQ